MPTRRPRGSPDRPEPERWPAPPPGRQTDPMLLPPLDEFLRILIVTPLAYVAVVVLLRISGKRSLAKLNAFDMIVTVALGSVLASTVTASGTALVAGLTGFTVLLLLQVIVSWLTSRRRVQTSLVRSEPTLLVRHGRLLTDAVAEGRLTEDEVRQAVRSQGIGGLDQVAAVCLESDGTLSVIPASSLGDESALTDVGAW